MNLWPIAKFTAAMPTLLPLLGVLLAPAELLSGRVIASAEMYSLLNRGQAVRVTEPAADNRLRAALSEPATATADNTSTDVPASWQLTDLVWVANNSGHEVRLLR